jgi:hypothetical protein
MSTSFTVTPNGTIKVRPTQKGWIHYRFKNMIMQKESGLVVDGDGNRIVVKRDSDQQLVYFVKHKNHWLLEKNTTNKSPLFGTEFICK